MATLDNVIGQLKDNKKSQDQTTTEVRKGNTLLSNYLEGMKTDRMKDLEAQRESMKKLAESLGKGGGVGGAAKGAKGAGGFNMPDWAKMGLGGLGGALAGSLLGRMLGLLSRLIAPVLAGLVALELASEGLRGWELGAVKKLTDLTKNLPSRIITGVGLLGTSIDDFVRSALRGFGIDEFIKDQDGKKVQNRDNGKFAKGFQVKKTLEMFQEALVKAKNGILNTVFGAAADADGNVKIQMPELDSKDLKMGDTIADALKAGEKAGDMSKIALAYSKIVTAFGKVITPVVSFGEAVGGIFTKFFSTFATAAKFLGITDAVLATGKIGASIIGKFGGLVGKFLMPLGLLFSGFKAVQDWMDNSDNADMSTSDKVVSAISAFISDFVGAPLDLLKMGFTWIYKKLFGLETDENGKIKPGQGLAGDIGVKLQNFSFVEFIDNFIEGAWGFIKSAFKELTKFFGDPVGYVTDAYNKFLEKNDADSIGGVISNWVTDLFEYIGSLLPTMDEIKEGISKTIEALVPDWARSWFGFETPPEVQAEVDRAQAENLAREQTAALNRLMGADTDRSGSLSLKELREAGYNIDRTFNRNNFRASKLRQDISALFPEFFKHSQGHMGANEYTNFLRAMKANAGQNSGNAIVFNQDQNTMNSTPLIIGSMNTVNILDPGS